MKTILVSAFLFLFLLRVSAQAPADDFLKTLSGSVEPSLGWYDGTTLKTEKPLVDGLLTTANSEWTCAATSAKSPEASEPDALDMNFTFKLKSGSDNQAAPSVSFKFGKWSTDNYVLIPASVYNGNRYNVLGNDYNPPYTQDMFRNPKLPLTISNNPRLSADGNSFLEVQTTNATTPAVCFFSPELKRGFILLTDQNTRLGNSGISITETADNKEAVIKITAPSMRKKRADFGKFWDSDDSAPSWKAEEEVTLHFRLFSFEASGIPDLLKRFFQVRKSLTGPNDSRNLLPMSRLKKYGTDMCKSRWVTVAAGSFYQPENTTDFFQFGWVGGLTNTYPMLALNEETERKRVGMEIDFAIDKMQGRSGYFYGYIKSDGTPQAEKSGDQQSSKNSMVRKNCDILLWLIKHFILLKKQGYESFITKKWETAAHSLAKAFVKTWEKDNQFGQYIDPDTGEILVYNSTAGSIAPGGLALASYYFHEDSFLKTAIESANYYYERDVVKQGLTGGGCGDISQDSDSESCFGFLESLMALYAVTGDKAWLDKAEVQAALCSTWTISYDAQLPPQSEMGILQGKTAGAVWASIQNKHGAPGICGASGDYIFKLYRATGNHLYADLMRDIIHGHTEGVHFPGHPTSGSNGASMERIQISDSQGKESIGYFLKGVNFWTVSNGTLMTMEVPGIYWQTEKNEVYVFDHMEVVRIEENGINKIKITNPTPFNASVTILMESSAQAKKPLLSGDFCEWPTVKVEAGESVIYPPECIPPMPCFKPKEANVWAVGDNYRFDFNGGKFQVSDRKGYGTNTASTSVSVCNKESGELLFYSDGKKVWNKNFEVMPAGSDLISGELFGQHALIVPKPGTKDKYFLFTVKCQKDAPDNGLYCSVVDMSLDKGLGDVVSDSKNKRIFADAVEALTATLHANGSDFWLVTHENGSNKFVVFPITDQGVEEESFFSIGPTYEPFPKGAAKGSIIISPDRTRLAFNLNTHQDIVHNEDENSPLELYDFSPNTGVISNRLVLEELSNIQTLIFSPDNTKLYAGCYDSTPPEDYGLLQFDLSAGTTKQIIKSRDFIKWPYKPVTGSEAMPSFKLQLGPDGKLYSGAMGIQKNGVNQRAVFYLERPNLRLKDAKPWFRYLDSPNNKDLNAEGYKPEQSFPNFMQYYFCGLESIETATVTAIEEEDKKSGETVTVFPNPSEEFLSIGSTSEKYLFPARIKIYNTQGKLLQEKEVASAPFPKIDISAFTTGVYVVTIQNQKGTTSVKVIKR